MMTIEKSHYPLAVVTAVSVTISAGFSIAGLIAPQTIAPAGSTPDAAAALFAAYAAARSIPLAIALFVAILTRALPALRALAYLAAMVQCSDAVIGVQQGDPGKTIGPLAIALIQLWLLRRDSKRKS